jgi:hypothetical protein
MITSSYKKIIVFVFFVVCAEVILIPVVLAGDCCTKYCGVWKDPLHGGVGAIVPKRNVPSSVS